MIKMKGEKRMIGTTRVKIIRMKGLKRMVRKKEVKEGKRGKE